MKTDRANTSSWKREVYRDYGTLFQTQQDSSIYDEYIPYATYIVKTVFPQNKEIKILDAGCGIGGFVKVCIDSGYTHVEGIDISEDSVAVAHKAGLLQVKHGDIFDYLKQLTDNTLDVILCLDVIEHFQREDAIRLLHEIFRLLRKGGTIVLHVPNAEGIFGSKVRYSDYTHEMAFTSRSLFQLLRFIGFDSPTCFEDKPIVHGFKSMVRRVLWPVVTFQFRFLHAVETGSFDVKLSQNILVTGKKP